MHVTFNQKPLGIGRTTVAMEWFANFCDEFTERLCSVWAKRNQFTVNSQRK